MRKSFEIVFLVALITGGCSSGPALSDRDRAALEAVSLRPQTPLTPRGRTLDPNSAPVVRGLLPGTTGQKAGLKPNDLIVSLNGKKISTIADYDVFSKFSGRNASVEIDRDGVKKTFSIPFNEERPRGGIEIEPYGIPVIRAGTPLVSTIHSKGFTIHAQASLSRERDELHVNFIIESNVILSLAPAKLVVYDLKNKKALLNTSENLDALGVKPLFITHKMSTPGNFDSPIRIALNISNDHFVFEFQ